MADSEPAAAEGPVSEGQDVSSPITPDTATDVAPTRRAKRRPEPNPAGEPEEAANLEEQPAQVKGWHENNRSLVEGDKPGLSHDLCVLICPRPADSRCASGRVGLLGQLG